MPDDELFRLARDGKLQAGDNLETQVRRMLSDPKAQALVENFAGQWLQLRNLKAVNPDKDQFPSFDEPLREAMQQETELFFDCGDARRPQHPRLPRLRLHVPERAAGPALRHPRRGRRELPPGAACRMARRGGLITQASILTVTSNPTRTSPVKRGKWVLEQILGTPPPPPPPNVPQLADDKNAVLTGTLRQRMEQHRANPSCASCHSRLDPLGFGFENFDAIGAWRTRTAAFADRRSGQLPGGESFSGPGELKAILRTSKDEFARCLTEKLLTYALGRGWKTTTLCTVDRIVAGRGRRRVPVLPAGARDRQERPVPEATRLTTDAGVEDEDEETTMTRSLRMSRRTVLRGAGHGHRAALARGHGAGGRRSSSPDLRPARARRGPGGWRSSTSPTACTWPTGGRSEEGAGFDLPPILEPLEPFKDELLVLTGLTQHKAEANGDGAGDHARALSCFLTGVQPRKTDGADIRAGISVDQVAAQKVGEQTRLPSLELGCERRRAVGQLRLGLQLRLLVEHLLALGDHADGQGGQPPARSSTASSAADGKAGSSAERQKRALYEKSILDFVREDAQQLRGRLGVNDQRKLDEYLTSLREIEQRIARADDGKADLPPAIHAARRHPAGLSASTSA